MRSYEVVTIPEPVAGGGQVYGLPEYQFDLVSGVTIKANDDGRPVRATVQPWSYGGHLALTFLGTDGPLKAGSKVGVIIEHR